MDTQDIRRILDQIDETIYISDLNTYEMLYLNRYGVAKFGGFKPGAKCYEHLQGVSAPCEFCTNKILPHCQGQRHTWVRQHPSVGDMLLHDSIIDYGGKPCRMELAISVERYVSEVTAAKQDLAAERKLVKCSFSPIFFTIAAYFSLSGSAYSASTSFVGSPPSSSRITRRVISSISEVEREKFRYLQPNSNGGHAGRICTSFAPLAYKNSVVSRS